jgi:uncharacterized surface protein with fasciclin (FAS1) repeats
MFRLLRPRRAAVVGVLGLALLGAACSSNDTDTTGNQSPAAPPTTAGSMTASGPFGAACSAVPASGAGSLEALAQDPVATAASNTPDLSTLVTAVKKAGLVDTLNSAQGITVFAPTNDAFSALPKATLDKALGDPDGLLTTVLTYHVVEGQLSPDQLAGSHKTLQGGTLEVSGSGEDFKVNGNATVYLIDQVLLPKS